MLVKWINAMALSFLLLPFVSIYPASANPVKGYDELIPLMVGKNGNYNTMLETIKSSQTIMLKEYLNKQNVPSIMKRYFNFRAPLALHQLNDRYLAVAFDAETMVQNLKSSAVWILLFKITAPGTVAYAHEFVTYETAEQIQQYNESPNGTLCEHFWDALKIKCNAAAWAKSNTQGRESIVEGLVSEEKLQSELSTKASISHYHKASDITSGTIQEKFIDDAICRDSELAAAIANVGKGKGATAAVVTSVALQPAIGRITQLELKSKEIATLQAEVMELKKTVVQLSQLLKGVSRLNNDILFNGVNLHIVNGTGSTEGGTNGLGNLVVGYNELKSGSSQKSHSGSHNVVIGKNLTYTSYGGLVVGEANTIKAPYAVVSGGFNNRASGKYSCVGGGQLNEASGDYATVSGGLTRKADKNNNWVGGDKSSPK
ncbi:MAG: hypothetical protein HKP58_18670 [Desulfatitalea sp.]|nr:hypothetical protein [Desulfatitalea sp.]NNK02440.1 hypothetical protein [Desulfatitalea sp.]